MNVAHKPRGEENATKGFRRERWAIEYDGWEYY
jgi:hypothetical protein